MSATYGTLLRLETRAVATVYGPFDVHRFRNAATGGDVLAVARGAVTAPAPLLARVHSSCVTSEVYGSCDCDCVEQLDAALGAIAEAGRGILFYLMQEGRGAGFTAKARDRMMVQASGERLTTFEAYARMGLARDHRSYEEVAFARRLLGVAAPLIVLTGNPEKVEELARAGVAIAGTSPLPRAASPFNLHYLNAKAPGGGGEPAALPEPVTYFEPVALPEAPHLLATASYLLPVLAPADGARRDAAGPPCWLRVHAYFDVPANRECVVLTYGARTDAAPLVRVQHTPLLERLPLAGGGERQRLWYATVRAVVRQGAGVAIVESAEGAEHGGGTVDPTTSRLLARHLPAARARLVLDGPGESAADRVLAAALRAAGVRLERPLVLRGAAAETPPGGDGGPDR